MELFDRYPNIACEFERMCVTRRNEVLQSMVDNSAEYNKLRQKRAAASMVLKEALGKGGAVLEEYADAVFAQECYELDAVYRQGFLDAVQVLMEQGLIC